MKRPLANSLHTFSCRLPLVAAAVMEKKLTNAVLPFVGAASLIPVPILHP